MQMDAQKDIIGQLDIDVPPQQDTKMQILDLTPVGIVNEIKNQKRLKKQQYFTGDDRDASVDDGDDDDKQPKNASDRNDDWKVRFNTVGADAFVVSPDGEEKDEDKEKEKKKKKKNEDHARGKGKRGDVDDEKKNNKKKEEKEENEEKEEKKKKRESVDVSVPRKRRQSTSSSPRQAPKRKRVSDESNECSDDDTHTTRRQPGYAMIKTEEDRLKYALECLLRKRNQRETGSKVSTSTCGVLTNDLIDFYETVVEKFERKFGRYIV
jgi:hypothetical protein